MIVFLVNKRKFYFFAAAVLLLVLSCEDEQDKYGALHIEINVSQDQGTAAAKIASGDITKVTISISGMDPVNIDVSSGTNVSRTIEDVPTGEQTVKVDLKNASGLIFWTQTQLVEVKRGETASPYFGEFSAENLSIELTSPNGGEIWQLGTTHPITWISSHPSIPVDIELISSGESHGWEYNTNQNTGNYEMFFDSSFGEGSEFKIRISYDSMIYDYGVYDESDDFFTLTTVPQPTITVTSPNGGETWGIGTTQTITWTSENDPGHLSIWFYKDDIPSDYMSEAEDDDGEYIWNISSGWEEGNDYKVRISSTSNENVYDESDNNFSLTSEPQPTITVTSPNGGETWELGSTHSITWSSSMRSEYVNIDLYQGGSAYQTIISNRIDFGSHSWTIPSNYDVGSEYKVKITSVSDSSKWGESDSYFTITAVPTITVTSPNGGEEWELGSTQDVTWTSSDLSGDVKIELYQGGSLYQTIVTMFGNIPGNYSWSVSSSLTAGTDYRVRISSVSDANVYDESDADFALSSGQESEPGFSATITASGDNIDYGMTFGFHPDATDGFDFGIDLYAPPAPPPPTFDAAIIWGGDRYYTQILNGSADDLVEHEYGIALAYPSDNLITLTWDNTGWSDMMSSCLLQDAFGGAMINVDMLSETSLQLTNPAFTELRLKVTPQ